MRHIPRLLLYSLLLPLALIGLKVAPNEPLAWTAPTDTGLTGAPTVSVVADNDGWPASDDIPADFPTPPAYPPDAPPPTATTAPADRPLPAVLAPPGWTVFTGVNAPIRFAHPADWTVTEAASRNQATITARPPDGGATLTIVRGGTGEYDFAAITEEELRELVRQRYTGHCDAATIDAPTRDRIAGGVFTGIGSTCGIVGVNFYRYVAIGVRDQEGWLITYLTANATFEDNFERFLAPMLNSLVIGRP